MVGFVIIVIFILNFRILVASNEKKSLEMKRKCTYASALSAERNFHFSDDGTKLIVKTWKYIFRIQIFDLSFSPEVLRVVVFTV